MTMVLDPGNNRDALRVDSEGRLKVTATATAVTSYTAAQLAAMALAGTLTPLATYVASDSKSRRVALTESLLVPDTPARRSDATVAVIGDSLACYSFQRLTISTISRSSDVLTVGATAHGIASNARIAIYGVLNDATMNVSWVPATRIDANTFTVPSVGPDGTGTGTSLRLANLENYSAGGSFASAMKRIGGRADMVYAGVRGGAQIADIVASGYVTACAAARPAACVVILGINDVTSSLTAAEIIVALRDAIFYPLIAAGIDVYWQSLLPLGAGYSGFAGFTAKLMDVNSGIRALASVTDRLHFVNSFDYVVDPLGATAGAAISGMLNGTDNLHTQDKGAYFAGTPIAAAMIERFPLRPVLVASNGDNYGTSTTSANMLDNGLMAGTAANGAGAFAGLNCPTKWVANSVTGTSGGLSQPARADGIGNDFQAVFTQTASSSQLLIQTQSSALNDGRLTGGWWYQLRLVVSATGVAASNCSTILAYLSTTVGGVSYNLGQINGYTGDSGVPTNDLSDEVWLSAPFWVPAGTQVGPQINIVARFYGTGGSALTLKVGRVSLVRLT